MNMTYKEYTGEIPDDYSDENIKFRAVAKQIYSVIAEIDWIKRQTNPLTAENENLDRLSETYGLTRKSAMNSTGKLKFGVDKVLFFPVEIKKGTVCVTSDGIAFQTTQDVILPPSTKEVEVDAIAIEPGTNGNVKSGKIKFLSGALTAIDYVINDYDFSGGTDKESDFSLRERIKIKNSQISTGSNLSYYEQKAMEVDGVGHVYAKRGAQAGCVDIYIAAETCAADDNLINSVKSKLSLEREINVIINVYAAKVIMANVRLSVNLSSGGIISDIQNEANKLFSEQFRLLKVGQSLNLYQMYSIVSHIDGIKDCKISISPSTNIPQNVLLVLNSVDVEELA